MTSPKTSANPNEILLSTNFLAKYNRLVKWLQTTNYKKIEKMIIGERNSLGEPSDKAYL